VLRADPDAEVVIALSGPAPPPSLAHYRPPGMTVVKPLGFAVPDDGDPAFLEAEQAT
jgi:hypothetical protein